jgi:hypothetical protein
MPSEQKIMNFLMLAFQYFSFQFFEEGIVSIVNLFGRIRININEYNNDKKYFTYF